VSDQILPLLSPFAPVQKSVFVAFMVFCGILCPVASLREIFICMTQEAAFGPLQGVKVLELRHVMADPVCGMMLQGDW
jgi:hypothetical protein